LSEKSIAIKLSPNIKDNDKITKQCIGHEKYECETGDVIINFNIKKHQYFERINGNDILYVHTINLLECLTGFYV
jgi:DnaJ-class molecular chaperone